MTNAAEADLLDLIFLNTDWGHVGNTGGLRGSTSAGSFYISLHTADPGEAGNQNTNEASYTSYTTPIVADAKNVVGNYRDQWRIRSTYKNRLRS